MELVEKFEEASRTLATPCVHIDRDQLESGLAAYLRGLGVRSVVVDSDRVHLEAFEHVDAPLADCGVTDVSWGIASTGTLAIPMTPDNRRTTSLVPPVHVALLGKEYLLPDLTTALDHLYQGMMMREDRPSSVVFVTGASRTADIELSLVVGVHGPRELHVVLY